jgi:hypothetical protein
MEHCARGIEGSTVLRFDILLFILLFQNLVCKVGVETELAPLNTVRDDQRLKIQCEMI